MTKEQEIIMKYESNILEIIENRDDFTTSDLQGCISAQLIMLARELKAIKCKHETHYTIPTLNGFIEKCSECDKTLNEEFHN